MTRLSIVCPAGLIVLCLTAALGWSAEPAEDATHTIFGVVMELRSGTPNVAVCLCDAATGMPLVKQTYEPMQWNKSSADLAEAMAVVVTDDKGRFRFENVPDGKYRLVAEKWTGPYKGVFEVHGTVIQLMGVADEIVVPRPTDFYKAQIGLTPPGRGIVQFDQAVPNDETFMLLSTSPPEFDPILAFKAMGASFHQHVIGINRMPLGKTTVIGVPDQPLYAFFFAADDSPGFAAVEVPPSRNGLVRVPAEPFVAGWSDARKTPPPKLAKLMKFMDAHSLTSRQLLNLPRPDKADREAYRAKVQERLQDLSREIDLGDGVTARVGDILAVEAYRRLKK